MASKKHPLSLPTDMPAADLKMMLDFLRKSSVASQADGRVIEDRLLTSLAIHLRSRHRPT